MHIDNNIDFLLGCEDLKQVFAELVLQLNNMIKIMIELFIILLKILIKIIPY